MSLVLGTEREIVGKDGEVNSRLLTLALCLLAQGARRQSSSSRVGQTVLDGAKGEHEVRWKKLQELA